MPVPMDRPYGPISAEFSTPIPNYVLTVVSDQDAVSPAAGVYSYAPGEVVHCSAQTISLGATQQVCVGWTASTGGGGLRTRPALTPPALISFSNFSGWGVVSM